jgi:deazaflavin-dependent oxidoreductase (nitroreductase family)
VSGWNANIIEEFRKNEGKVGGGFEGATLLLLHTTGRKTRRERVNPLAYLPDDGRWVVFGSKGGALTDPDWVRNVEANPHLVIEVGTETIPVRATKILREGSERDGLYARQVARMRGFAEYEEKTRDIRKIPVIVLERREA